MKRNYENLMPKFVPKKSPVKSATRWIWGKILQINGPWNLETHKCLLVVAMISTVHLLKLINIYRNSHRKCSIAKSVLKIFCKIRRKNLCQGLFFEKKKRFWHRCFPVNSAGFLRTSFLQNTSTSVSINSTISLKPFTPSKLNLASHLSKIGNSLIDDWDKIRLASSLLLFFLPLPIFPLHFL